MPLDVFCIGQFWAARDDEVNSFLGPFGDPVMWVCLMFYDMVVV